MSKIGKEFSIGATRIFEVSDHVHSSIIGMALPASALSGYVGSELIAHNPLASVLIAACGAGITALEADAMVKRTSTSFSTHAFAFSFIMATLIGGSVLPVALDESAALSQRRDCQASDARQPQYHIPICEAR